MEHPSTDAPISGNFPDGKPMTEQTSDTCPAKKNLSEPNHTSSSETNVDSSSGPNHASSLEPADRQTSWCYIYLHNRRIEAFQSYMNEKSPFQSFVLKAHPIRRDKRGKALSAGKGTASAGQTPRQLLIGGIVFIQGAPEEIQRFFKQKSLFFTLVHDCATQRPAILPDETMRPLRQVVELASERISFLPKPFAHYAEGHQLVRIIDGPLTGLEGCILRINRDRKLVMQAGKLTLALSRAHRESFEVVATEATAPSQKKRHRPLTYLQEQLDKNLFFPQTQAEVKMYADNIALLADRALKLLQTEKDGKSAPRQELSSDILLFLLEEIAYHFDSLHTAPRLDLAPIRRLDLTPARRFDLAPIRTIAQQLTATISQLASPADSRLSASEKERLSERCDAITLGQDWLFHG